MTKSACYSTDRTLLISTRRWPHAPDIYLRLEEQRTQQQFVEKIGMVLCRPYVDNLNSPLATFHHLR